MPKVSGYRLGKLTLLALMLTIASMVSAQYPLKFLPVDKDTVFVTKTLGLQQNFATRLACVEYVNDLIPMLQTKGYTSASIDSVAFDSAAACIKLFFGG